eukprot:6188637-Pleurochrysis_carterae.AAC.5
MHTIRKLVLPASVYPKYDYGKLLQCSRFAFVAALQKTLPKYAVSFVQCIFAKGCCDEKSTSFGMANAFRRLCQSRDKYGR